MMKSIQRGLRREEGFTLIELMVVVMIIAILIAIAIPSFLGFRKNAQDRAAQSDLRTVLLAQNALFLENGEFTANDADILAFEANAPVGADAVVMTTGDATEGNLCLTRVSDSGTTFGIYVFANGPTYYGEGSCAAATEPDGWSRQGWGAAVADDGGGGGDDEGGDE